MSAAFWQAALFLTLSRLISIKDCVVDFLSLSSLVEDDMGCISDGDLVLISVDFDSQYFLANQVLPPVVWLCRCPVISFFLALHLVIAS